MSIDPEFSIVISFIGFAWIFAKKILPMINQKLDDHILSVKNNISNAERMQLEAFNALDEAKLKATQIEKIISENKKKSAEHIKNIKKENEKLINDLKERYEISLQKQLDAELSKQKKQLIEKLSDLITSQLANKISSSKKSMDLNIQPNDLRKFLDS